MQLNVEETQFNYFYISSYMKVVAYTPLWVSLPKQQHQQQQQQQQQQNYDAFKCSPWRAVWLNLG